MAETISPYVPDIEGSDDIDSQFDQFPPPPSRTPRRQFPTDETVILIEELIMQASANADLWLDKLPAEVVEENSVFDGGDSTDEMIALDRNGEIVLVEGVYRFHRDVAYQPPLPDSS